MENAQPVLPRDLGPVRVEPLRGVSPPVFAQLGPAGPHKLVFLHGMCGHGMGYAQSFQFAAAKRGRLISLQGDIVCGSGPWAKWSGDLDKLDARIVAAFEALGYPSPIEDVTLIGYSQGATRVEALARRRPERYTRVVLMGAPSPASARGFARMKSTVMMAGERDRQDLMKANVRRFAAAKIPSTFIELPGATHGAMGQNPERTMDAALEWLFTHTREVEAPKVESARSAELSAPASKADR